MLKFKFPESIKSRPIYGILESRAGKSHLCIADGDGALAICELAKSNSDMLAHTQIIFITKYGGDQHIKAIEALEPAQLYIGPSFEAARQRIQHVLANAHMGLQLYLSGTEGLMGQSMLEAINAGIPHSAIQTEHRGSIGRRMQCVHCKGITEDVISDPFQCAHCGLNLFVRDHYSRRLAAFQGVCIDAEDPGNVPESQELYK